MAQKLKKKPSFFTLKRWNSKTEINEPPSPKNFNAPATALPQSNGAPNSLSNNHSHLRHSPMEQPKSTMSAGNLDELIQCFLCLEVLHNPKMLPCQHTFCMACLSVHIGDRPMFTCPICRTKIKVPSPNFLKDLPSNLYIDSLLSLVGLKEPTNNRITPPSTPAAGAAAGAAAAGTSSVDLFAGGVRCAVCQSVCDNNEVTCCRHCKLNFCRVCLCQHLDDMKAQIVSIINQLESASKKLEYKLEHYKDRCERITEHINIAADEKINTIIKAKDGLLKQTAGLQKNSEMTALGLKMSIEEAKDVAKRAVNSKENVNENAQVTTFMNLHQNTNRLLAEVSKWDAESFVFDKENFCIELDAASPLDAESDEPLPEGEQHNNPMENEDTLTLHYRSQNFIPHYVWRKTTRPCGIGLSPWNNDLYICCMDSHSVLVIERTQAKIVARLSCEDMLCPVQIAFMKSNGEIYVTDKWKHCIHVFSKDNVYLRSICNKGSRVGLLRSPEGIATDNSQLLLYVVDTGNDRIQILQPDGKFVELIGVRTYEQITKGPGPWTTKNVLCTELNAPTSVAVTKDRIVVLDSGNRRVKVYSKEDKGKILEFGSLGHRKGQFRQPEVLAVDPMGFIIVGDSGNCRVQIFKPNGQLVRVFGRCGKEAGKFSWISGIHITKQLDIIVSDPKNHAVNFF